MANAAAPLVEDVSTLPPISLHLTDYLPPVPGIVPSYSRLKLRAKRLLLSDWSAARAPPYYPDPPSTRPHPFMGLGKFVAGRIHEMRSGKSYLAAHPSWGDPDADKSCPLCSEAPQTFVHAILSCPSAACQRSRLLQGISDLGPRPLSGPTSSCSLRWLSSSAPLPPVSLRGCPLLPPPSVPLLRILSSRLLPHPPLALETSLAVFTFLD